MTTDYDVVNMLREYHYDPVLVDAANEIEALRAEVERLKAVAHGFVDEIADKDRRAERLAEALRDARDYVTTALREEREKFAGHEDCSDIPGIEADLHKIDSALNPTAAQEKDDA